MKAALRRLLLPLVVLAAAPPAVAQAPETGPPQRPWVVPMRTDYDYLRPFRNPGRDIAPPQELYDELRTMLALLGGNRERELIDDEGRRAVDIPAWKEARSRLLTRIERMAGYLAIVAQESSSAEDRRIAYFGGYYVNDVAEAVAILSLVPSEPVRAIREENLRYAIDFLAVHLPQNRGGEAARRPATPVDHAEGRAIGSWVYEDPAQPKYDFDELPFCALVEVGDARDQAQALWFLTRVVEIRADYAKRTFSHLHTLLPPLLVHEDETLRQHARAYLHAVDPTGAEPPPADAGNEAVQRWLATVVEAHFPPIRPISEGLIELYPSAVLDAVARVGRKGLADESIGQPRSGTAGGQYYRGFELMRLPEPLDKLGLPKGAVVTHVNGAPTPDAQALLGVVEQLVEQRRAMIVEYVWRDRVLAMEYRLR